MKRDTLFCLLIISFMQLSFISQVAMLLTHKHKESKIESVGITVLVN